MVCQRSNGVSPKLVSQIETKVEQLRDIYKNQQFKTVIMSNYTHTIFYHDPKILLSNNQTTSSPSNTSSNNPNTTPINNTPTQPITIVNNQYSASNGSGSPPPIISPTKKPQHGTNPSMVAYSPKDTMSATNLTSQIGISASHLTTSTSQSSHSPTTEGPPNMGIGFVVGSVEDLAQRLRQYLESVENFVKLFSEDETQQFINQGIYHIRGCSGILPGGSNNISGISSNGGALTPTNISNCSLGSPTLICSIFVKTDITCAIFTDVYEQDAIGITEDMDNEILEIVDQLQLLLKSTIEKEKTVTKKK
ncbi:hypothetical protein C9374_002618 [Naegleria lovaniensis]|uniref:Uncharacterized protein n=1 Tax=Naegleria lovaniensis TaxID=51637 RepID=A0AA88KQ85_NAELO|nr:uncharacterized protein C9374_002618 [Naegleria lovaniensis]KAG2386172.1 hypothetical protein C9374_002618 [Naegleria lovaniensis]